MKHVIIGAGVAGITAAQTIREMDKDAEVVVIGDERFLPYKRYLLTEFLTDSVKKEELIYTSLDSLKENRIKLRKGQFVKSISTADKTITFSHNEVMSYDRLLIATGGRPGLGPVLRTYKQYIQRYYSLKDILLLKKKLAGIHSCVVFGDGLSSLDLICGLHNLGKEITFVVKGAQVDFSLTEAVFYGQLHDYLVKRGIRIVTEDRLISVQPHGDGFLALTLQQRELEADLIFAWDYYKPNIACIKGTPVEKKLGVLVNPQLKTSEEDVYAAGDCVEIYHPELKDYWINFGWPNALEQGRTAGRNMMGAEEEYKIKDTLVLKLMGKSLQARWWK